MSRKDWNTLWTASCRSAVSLLLHQKLYDVYKAVSHDESLQCPSFRCLNPRGWAAVVQVARELVAQRQKDRALLALKRRKLHEQQLEKLVSEETFQLRGLAETCCACFACSVNLGQHVCCAGHP